jgi:hypothetical protein
VYRRDGKDEASGPLSISLNNVWLLYCDLYFLEKSINERTKINLFFLKFADIFPLKHDVISRCDIILRYGKTPF